MKKTAFSELVESERRFFYSLQALKIVYYDELSTSEGNVVSKEELETIFGASFSALLPFFEGATKSLEDGGDGSIYIGLLKSIVPFVKEFIRKQKNREHVIKKNEALSNFRKTTNADLKMDLFLKQHDISSQGLNLELGALLSSVYQRLPKWKLMFARILEESEDKNQRELFHMLSEKVEDVLRSINEEIREQENQSHLDVVLENMTGGNFQHKAHRRLLVFGTCRYKNRVCDLLFLTDMILLLEDNVYVDHLDFFRVVGETGEGNNEHSEVTLKSSGGKLTMEVLSMNHFHGENVSKAFLDFLSAFEKQKSKLRQAGGTTQARWMHRVDGKNESLNVEKGVHTSEAESTQIAFFNACSNGNVEEATTLLKSVGNASLWSMVTAALTKEELLEKEFHGFRPLQVAALNGHLGIVELLLQHGAKADALNNGNDDESWTAMHFACFRPSLNTVTVLEALYQHDKELLSAVSSKGTTLAQSACYWGNVPALEFLISKGADVESPQKPSLNTPLHWASERNHAQCVDVLLRHGVNPLRKNAKGERAICLAVNMYGCFHDVFDMYLRHGIVLSPEEVEKLASYLRISSAKDQALASLAQVLEDQNQAQVGMHNFGADEQPQPLDNFVQLIGVLQELENEEGFESLDNLDFLENFDVEDD